MAYTYYDWASQATTAAKLTRLNLHIGEVTLQMGPSVSRDGASRSTADIMQYLRLLTEQQRELQSMPDAASDGKANINRARFG